MTYSSYTMSIDARGSLENTKRRLHDLKTFQLPRLLGCNGPLGLFRDLAEEMKVDLEAVRRSLEMSRELAEVGPDRREDLLSELDGVDQELQELRTAYRAALISARRNITTQARSRRHELLKSRASDDPALKVPTKTGVSGDDALQTKTNEVTDALRRTTTLMQTELEKSVLSVQMLDESTRTLNLTQTLYDNYTSLLATSSHLVKAIERADWYDRLLIFAAFAFFLLVVGWVLKRRVLDKVVGGLGWYVGGSYRLVRMGLGGKSGKAASSASGKARSVAVSLSSTATALSATAGSAAAAISAALSTPPHPSEILDEAPPLEPQETTAAHIPDSAPADSPTAIKDEL